MQTNEMKILCYCSKSWFSHLEDIIEKVLAFSPNAIPETDLFSPISDAGGARARRRRDSSPHPCTSVAFLVFGPTMTSLCTASHSIPLLAFSVVPSSAFRKAPNLRFRSFTGSPAAVTITNRLGKLHRLSHLLSAQSILHGSQSPLHRNLCSRNSYSLSRSESMCSTTAKRSFGVDTTKRFASDTSCRLGTADQLPRHINGSVLSLDDEPHRTSSFSDGKTDYGACGLSAHHKTLISFRTLSKWAFSTSDRATNVLTSSGPFLKIKRRRQRHHGSVRQIPPAKFVSVPNSQSEMKRVSITSPSRLQIFLLPGSIEIYLVSRGNKDNYRAVLFRLMGALASLGFPPIFKPLSLGYFNVSLDYLKLSRAVVSRIQSEDYLRISLL
ncbi:hypothetical protein DY000_02026591 [Brassica cretica]|uniref:Uncharacterized protein n=1 Tax=Brassica cretica TaxID=69181 RepID=A0ABQ7EDG5_BRACR|nr:hypothetical protein DY000_02026591 [Brassica cretica]